MLINGMNDKLILFHVNDKCVLICLPLQPKPKMDLLVSEDHTFDAGTKQNHTGHVLAVVDQESKGISWMVDI